MIIASKKYKNKNIAILGLGNTGISAINTFLSAQAKVYAWDDSKKLHLKAKLLGAIILDLSSNSWPPIDLLFVSPGIPLKYPKPHPAICEAKSKKIRITSDIEIFYEALKEQNFFPKIIGVTGIVIGGFNYESLSKILGYNLGVAITGSEEFSCFRWICCR